MIDVIERALGVELEPRPLGPSLMCVAIVAMPFALALALAVQTVGGCDGPTRGLAAHSVASMLQCTGAVLAAVLAWEVWNRCRRPGRPPAGPVPYSTVVAVLESADLAVGVALCLIGPVVVVQLAEIVLVHGAPVPVVAVTAAACAACTVGLWTDELVRLRSGGLSGGARWTMLVPQLTTCLERAAEIRRAAAVGSFEPRDPGDDRARAAMAFAAYAVASWLVIAIVHHDLSCNAARVYAWHTDLVDLALLELSAAACLSFDWGPATTPVLAWGTVALGVVYAVGAAWLQTTVVV
jgi:hypothetical protein